MANRIILSLGSNTDQERNIADAGHLLDSSFVSISFSVPVYTVPINISCSGHFLNQVAIAFTEEGPDEVNYRLKQIERQLRRTPEGNATGVIPIDIDLLQWNDLILKPEDLQRDYVKAGIRFLQEIESGGHQKIN
ncbi:2-amino-4-hydroxy-6-hydroxymethyldihydropteridine diphosphokinase [Parabacteroides faecis]|uniref:2-amino-4-hydroxy-6- hydroxymethyldihydropteridine diphosphokinase n=1 Tax=Parabacteroides TaxID=375288 RepID=UPI000EFEB953|nr:MULTISPECIES: 2-amino-4-hydroxy-6-hydroxymethyldihydropteridine diphosphokinase [Parabacteroides]MBC8619332.1 2-amino-4-hydroxy-6-hydroxymethyldihydropteridine diphosphokinase [Parabacteroides faecis]MCS2894177.1 2-amino-4-hydroxy-6-hydroxymethyldihydropteridine diphosphokinase [Parabacteroides faecis]RHR36271.1 2-amino-4-hydroxy-6-hydroxymethyldihydropteridine pyrophosphokinase [Parabacteroides sp. AF18-52]RHR92838.1 2-amino-4-hydroxy-6-hydroxymethyldihydropteridine pyrophosphokinase [Parab